MRKILVFGNDESINTIDFRTIDGVREGTGTLTIGLNRIWRRYMPDYFVFMDSDVMNELILNNVERPEHSTWITSDFLFNNPDTPLSEEEYRVFQDYIHEQGIKVYPRPLSFTKRKSSLLWSIIYLQEYLYSGEQLRFYLFGTKLNVPTKGAHHFWERDRKVVYNRDLTKLNTQFSSHTTGLKELRSKRYDIISATKNSRANKFIPYINQTPIEIIKSK